MESKARRIRSYIPRPTEPILLKRLEKASPSSILKFGQEENSILNVNRRGELITWNQRSDWNPQIVWSGQLLGGSRVQLSDRFICAVAHTACSIWDMRTFRYLGGPSFPHECIVEAKLSQDGSLLVLLVQHFHTLINRVVAYNLCLLQRTDFAESPVSIAGDECYFQMSFRATKHSYFLTHIGLRDITPDGSRFLLLTQHNMLLVCDVDLAANEFWIAHRVSLDVSSAMLAPSGLLLAVCVNNGSVQGQEMLVPLPSRRDALTAIDPSATAAAVAAPSRTYVPVDIAPRDAACTLVRSLAPDIFGIKPDPGPAPALLIPLTPRSSPHFEAVCFSADSQYLFVRRDHQSDCPVTVLRIAPDLDSVETVGSIVWARMHTTAALVASPCGQYLVAVHHGANKPVLIDVRCYKVCASV